MSSLARRGPMGRMESSTTRRRRLILLASLGLLSSGYTAASAPAQPQAHQGGLRTHRFAKGRISFAAPEQFTPLSPDEMKRKFPSTGAPRQAVGNPKRTTTIAYDLLDQPAPSNDLEAARRMFAGAYERGLRDLKWVASDVRRIGAREWAYLEFTAAAVDQDIHNIVMVSVFDGRVLMFNFNSTVREFSEVERTLRASIRSIATSP